MEFIEVCLEQNSWLNLRLNPFGRQDEVVLRKNRIQNNENVNINKTTSGKLNLDLDVCVSSLANKLKSKFETYSQSNRPKSVHIPPTSSTSYDNEDFGGRVVTKPVENCTLCYVCEKKVYLMERLNVLDLFMHAKCFRCEYCSRELRNNFSNQYAYVKDPIMSTCKTPICLDLICRWWQIHLNVFADKFYCANHVGMVKNTKSTTNTDGIQRRRSLLIMQNDNDEDKVSSIEPLLQNRLIENYSRSSMMNWTLMDNLFSFQRPWSWKTPISKYKRVINQASISLWVMKESQSTQVLSLVKNVFRILNLGKTMMFFHDSMIPENFIWFCKLIIDCMSLRKNITQNNISWCLSQRPSLLFGVFYERRCFFWKFIKKRQGFWGVKDI